MIYQEAKQLGKETWTRVFQGSKLNNTTVSLQRSNRVQLLRAKKILSKFPIHHLSNSQRDIVQMMIVLCKKNKVEQFHTFSLWSPPTMRILKIRSSSSRSSNLSWLVVAGSPDLTLTSLTLPISRSPCTTHLLTKGLYLCGWSNLRTRDQTYNFYITKRKKELAILQPLKNHQIPDFISLLFVYSVGVKEQ